MDYQFSESIIELKLLADRLAEGIGRNAGIFQVKHQILFVISRNKQTAPKELIERLNIAKSNLALACNALIREGLIEKSKDEDNKKEIFYTITESGLKELKEKYRSIELICETSKKPKLMIAKSQKLLDIVNNIKNS